MAGRQQIEIWQGEDRTLSYALLDGGAPLDITDWTLIWRAWQRGNNNIFALAVSLDAPANGECSVDLEAADTALVAGTYLYEMRRTDSGSVTTVLVGTLTIHDSPFVAV